MHRLITILALALLLVGGCRENISPEKYKELSARADTIVANHKRLEATLRGILGYLPCPPCPPETVEVMPPGRWVKAGVYCYWHVAYWMGDSLKMQQFGPIPDSVFILKGE